MFCPSVLANLSFLVWLSITNIKPKLTNFNKVYLINTPAQKAWKITCPQNIRPSIAHDVCTKFVRFPSNGVYTLMNNRNKMLREMKVSHFYFSNNLLCLFWIYIIISMYLLIIISCGNQNWRYLWAKRWISP